MPLVELQGVGRVGVGDTGVEPVKNWNIWQHRNSLLTEHGA